MENSLIQINDLTTSGIDPVDEVDQVDLAKMSDVVDLKEKLENWKFLLLPINNLLEWEHKYAPFLIIFFDSFLFGLLLYYNPSILTTISIIGLTCLISEFSVPFLSGYLFKSTEWNAILEAKYTRICQRLSNFRAHFNNFKIKLENTRREKQPLYFLIVFFFLIFCAYVGQSVDNLLLSYLAVLVLTLTPGARRHQLLPRMLNKVKRTLGFNTGASVKSYNASFQHVGSSSTDTNKTK